MALKMMAVSAIDKQFIDDNMLTDADFDVDDAEFEEMAVLESLPSELQMEYSSNANQVNTQPVSEVQALDLASNLDDLFNDIVYDFDFKVEPLSPEVSAEVLSSDDMSVVTIPEVGNYEQIGMIADTPPHTPPGVADTVPNSPSNCSRVDSIVSAQSASATSYTISPGIQLSHESIISPVKFAVNIQPKRDASDVKNTATVGHSTSNTEQIVKLANGTVKLKAPVNVAIPVSNVLQASKTANSLPSIVSVRSVGRPGSSQNHLVEVCAAAIKRQERIIKNRESAYLSRKRKKEYVQKLESELTQISAENASLREENCRLKLKISDLENEVLKLKSSFSPRKMKNTACLMIAVCMLTFNLSLYSSIFDKASPKLQRTDLKNHRVGRVLLWDADYDSQRRNSTKSLYSKRKYLDNEIESPYIVDMDKTFNSSCQHYINKTESIRLENDLLGWVERVEKKQKLKASRKLGIVDIKAPLPTLHKLQSLSRRKGEKKDIWAKRKSQNEILIYQTPRKAYEDFFEAIHRRDDTFYFVSFSGDHLLLPAISHNQTLRPRMSFVMPAMTLNDSVDETDEHVSMMQIDCEVMDTKLVYIKESVIPSHLRQKQNSTSKSNARHSTKYAVNHNSRSLQSSGPKVHLHPSGNG